MEICAKEVRPETDHELCQLQTPSSCRCQQHARWPGGIIHSAEEASAGAEQHRTILRTSHPPSLPWGPVGLLCTFWKGKGTRELWKERTAPDRELVLELDWLKAKPTGHKLRSYVSLASFSRPSSLMHKPNRSAGRGFSTEMSVLRGNNRKLLFSFLHIWELQYTIQLCFRAIVTMVLIVYGEPRHAKIDYNAI